MRGPCLDVPDYFISLRVSKPKTPKWHFGLVLHTSDGLPPAGSNKVAMKLHHWIIDGPKKFVFDAFLLIIIV